jgi:hypothetical protein
MGARDAHQPVSSTRHEARQKECHTNQPQLARRMYWPQVRLRKGTPLSSCTGSLLGVAEATGRGAEIY